MASPSASDAPPEPTPETYPSSELAAHIRGDHGNAVGVAYFGLPRAQIIPLQPRQCASPLCTGRSAEGRENSRGQDGLSLEFKGLPSYISGFRRSMIVSQASRPVSAARRTLAHPRRDASSRQGDFPPPVTIGDALEERTVWARGASGWSVPLARRSEKMARPQSTRASCPVP